MFLITLVFAGSFVYVWALTPTSTHWLNPGIYPGTYDYTVWTEGGNYYAKDHNGYLAYSSANASYVFNSAVDDGDSLFLMVGTYTIDSTILVSSKTSFSFIGESWDAKIRLASSTNKNMMNITSSDYVTVRDVSFDGNSAGQTSGVSNAIDIDECYRTNIEHNKLYDVRNTTIYAEGSALHYSLQGWADKNYIQNATVGIHLDTYTQDWHITNNDIGWCDSKGIDVTLGGSNFIISDNTVWGNLAGIFIYQALGGAITGNRVDYNIDEGIYLSASRNIALTGNNVFYNSIGVNGTHSGILLYNSQNCTITGGRLGNDYLGAKSETQKFGLEGKSTENWNVVTGVNANGNQNATYDIYLLGANDICSNETNIGRIRLP